MSNGLCLDLRSNWIPVTTQNMTGAYTYVQLIMYAYLSGISPPVEAVVDLLDGFTVLGKTHNFATEGLAESLKGSSHKAYTLTSQSTGLNPQAKATLPSQHLSTSTSTSRSSSLSPTRTK